jgi:hypothetical protein
MKLNAIKQKINKLDEQQLKDLTGYVEDSLRARQRENNKRMAEELLLGDQVICNSKRLKNIPLQVVSINPPHVMCQEIGNPSNRFRMEAGMLEIANNQTNV